MKAFLAPKEKPSPLFSEAIKIFLESKDTTVKSTVVKSYERTFKRFLEVCGDKPMRDYTGADVGHFKAVMEQLPESYGKQRNDTRTVQEFVADAKKRKLARISGKPVKNHAYAFKNAVSKVVHRESQQQKNQEAVTFP